MLSTLLRTYKTPLFHNDITREDFFKKSSLALSPKNFGLGMIYNVQLPSYAFLLHKKPANAGFFQYSVIENFTGDTMVVGADNNLFAQADRTLMIL